MHYTLNYGVPMWGVDDTVEGTDPVAEHKLFPPELLSHCQLWSASEVASMKMEEVTGGPCGHRYSDRDGGQGGGIAGCASDQRAILVTRRPATRAGVPEKTASV